MSEINEIQDSQWEPFRRFKEDLSHLHALLVMATNGILRETNAPQMVKSLQKYDDVVRELEPEKPVHSEEFWSERLESARVDAEFAKAEVESGFARLFAFGAISIYASLEAHVENILVARLSYIPEAWQLDEIRKVRISISDYENLSFDERSLYVIDQLERESNAVLRDGVSRFEALLSKFQFGGNVQEETRKDIFELAHIRNVLLHRGGIADRRLCLACPWLSLKPGERVIVNGESFARYLIAALDYSLAIFQRITHANAQNRLSERSSGVVDAPNV